MTPSSGEAPAERPARFISVEAAAEKLGISPQSYYRGVATGEFPGTRTGGPNSRITVSIVALERLVGQLQGTVTVEQAARILGISPTSYRRGVRLGTLPCCRLGRRTVVLVSDLDKIERKAIGA